MESLIPLFFIGNVVAALLLGFKFISRNNNVLKMFGWGLLFNAIAFLMWTVAVVLNVSNITAYTTAGSIFFIIALAMFFVMIVKSKNLSEGNQSIIITVGVILMAILFYVRTYVLPSSPFISEDGLFFFNLPSIIQMLYIIVIILIITPAIETVASKFKGCYQTLVLYGFLIQVAGGIVLLTTTDVVTLYVVGWIIGVVYLFLWTTLLFSKKAWLENN